MAALKEQVVNGITIPKGKRLHKYIFNGQTHGVIVDASWPDWHADLVLFGNAKGEKKLALFKSLVGRLWPEPKFIWDRWADLFFGALCGASETIERITGVKIEADYDWWKYVLSTGAAACVAGHTRIYNPITGKHTKIEDLYAEGKPSWVMTLNGPALADIPFIKGVAELFQVTLTDGSSFTATGQHRVLTPSGYVHVSELRAGSTLHGYDESHLQTISDNGPKAHGEDALHWLNTAPNSQCDCLSSPCSCGEQLPSEAMDGQGDSTSQADVRERNFSPSIEHLDGRGDKSERSRFCQDGDRPSTARFSRPSSLSEKLASLLLDEEIHLLLNELFQQRGQSQPRNSGESSFPEQYCGVSRTPNFSGSDGHAECQPSLSQETLLHCRGSLQSRFQSRTQTFPHDACASRDRSFGGTCYPTGELMGSLSHDAERQKQVQEIKRVGADIFYDITVPVIHHYFAEGVIHHNTGKSSRCAMWVLINWIVERKKTSAVLTSTSIEQLKRRIWSELMDWIGKCEVDFSDLLEIVPSETLVRWHERDTKSAIFGRAVDQGGSVENAVGRIKGVHNTRMFVVVDEMTAMPEAIAKACRNLESGTKEFQFMGLGNATDRNDQHGIYCEPMNGWDSIDVDTEFWLTKMGGCCVRLDGMKSPAFQEPERFHFYIGKKKIDDDIRFFGGENSREFWSEDRGFWAPTGISNNIMDDALLTQFKVRDKAIWKGSYEMCSFLDVAFEGGDRRILYPFKMGEFASGVKGIEFQPPIVVSVDMKADKRFIHYAISDAVQQHCEQYECDGKRQPVSPENFCMDVTGEGAGVFSILSGRWSPRIQPCEFGGAADKTQIAPDRPTTWYELYGNRVTMLWYGMRRFIEGGQVRGLTDPETIIELTSRKRETKGGKIHAVPKVKMKLTTNRSPDKADACVGSAFLMRLKGIMPNGEKGGAQFSLDGWNKKVIRMNRSFDDASYQEAKYG